MGDRFQTIVDRDATEEEAGELAIPVRDWLIAEGIIEPVLKDCILSDELGYPPGPNYADATEQPFPLLFETATNGLEIIVKREVFYSRAGEQDLVCAVCCERFEPPKGWGAAIGEWYYRRGPGMLVCPLCGATRPITEWEHDPPWGFGNLGFRFWNWPLLKASFVEEVARRLGHRVVVPLGKI
jgi:hypothetical protein